jgi:hypothetical protein
LVVGPVTVQANVPLVALVVTKAGLTVVQVAPPSRLTDMATRWPTPRLWVNVMFSVLAMRLVTAVVGAVSVSDAVPETMLKLAFDVADALRPAPSRAVTRMRPWVVVGPGAVHVQLWAEPGRPVQAAMGVKVPPPLDENATSTAVTPTASAAVHRMT